MDDVRKVFDLLEKHGGNQYCGEPVSQLEHALQCATLALGDNAGDALITAGLFHDIGHLLDYESDQAAKRGIDLAHEEVAAEYLSDLFGPEVIEPIRLHVPAKRYLCATDPAYMASLSPASVESLVVQGGPYSEAEADLFIAGRHGPSAIKLRRWDDMAKDREMTVLTLSSFHEVVRRVLL